MAMKGKSMVALVLAAAMLAACGRAGAPITPSQAAREEAKANQLPPPDQPAPNAKNDDKRFILDGLLE